MPRTKLAEPVKEKLANRLANLNNNGSDKALDRTETILWTLRTVGFTEESIKTILDKAIEVSNDLTE